MLSMADRSGNVYASVPGLAHRARVSADECRDALSTLSAPDEESRTKLYEGRRILAFEGGWTLLNHAKYRKIQDEEAIRESKKEYMRKVRSGSESGIVTSTLGTVEKSALNLISDSGSDLDLTTPNKSKRRAKPKTEMPEGFAPNARHQTVADEEGVDLASEFQRFVDNCAKRAARYANWDAALREWLRNSKRFGGATQAQQSLKYKFRPDWKPKPFHRAKGLELGLTDDEIIARKRDCLLKPIKCGFVSEDEHFMRELVWAKERKDSEKAKRESYATRKAFETPGADRQR
jgi:hypothetical protein